MNDYNVVREAKEYIPDPDEDIIENAPLSTRPLIITDTSSEREVYVYRFYHILWLVLGSIETVLLFRFFFKVIGANTLSGFTDFIYTMSTPFMTPFAEIVPTTLIGASTFEWSTLIAMAVFFVLGYGIFELTKLLYPLHIRPRRHISRRTRYAI